MELNKDETFGKTNKRCSLFPWSSADGAFLLVSLSPLPHFHSYAGVTAKCQTCTFLCSVLLVSVTVSASSQADSLPSEVFARPAVSYSPACLCDVVMNEHTCVCVCRWSGSGCGGDGCRPAPSSHPAAVRPSKGRVGAPSSHADSTLRRQHPPAGQQTLRFR